METHASLAGGHLQLLAHHIAIRIVRQLQIVDARHHRWQILVRVLVAVHLLAHDRERWRERLEAAGWQPRTAGDELQEQPLLVPIVRSENVVEELNRRRVLVEAVVRSAAFRQHSDVPALLIGSTDAGSAEHVLQLLRVEHLQTAHREDGIKSWRRRQNK